MSCRGGCSTWNTPLRVTEKQKAMFGVGQMGGALPGDGGDGGDQGVDEAVSGEDEDLSAGSNPLDGDAAGRLHLIDGAQGDSIVEFLGRHGFDALRPDFGVQMKAADCFAEKCCLSVLGFSQSDVNLRVREGYRDSGETGPGAEIEEGVGGRSEVPSAEEAVGEVPEDNFARLTDGGEVGAGIPFEKQREIGGKLFGQGRISGDSSGCQKRGNLCRRKAHGRDTVFGIGCQARAAWTRASKMFLENWSS